jgi:hypothetical protein
MIEEDDEKDNALGKQSVEPKKMKQVVEPKVEPKKNIQHQFFVPLLFPPGIPMTAIVEESKFDAEVEPTVEAKVEPKVEVID